MHTFLNTACMFSLLLGLLCKLVNLSAVGRGRITARLCFPDVVLRYLRFTLATPAILYTDYSNREACRVMQYQCLTESSAKLLMLYGVYICRTGMHPESQMGGNGPWMLFSTVLRLSQGGEEKRKRFFLFFDSSRWSVKSQRCK